MSDFLSAFGAMDVGKLEFDDVDAKQAIREERFRNAFRHARDTYKVCLLYTSPSARDEGESRMPSSA